MRITERNKNELKNVYKFTYMGNCKIKCLDYEIKPQIPIILRAYEVGLFLESFPNAERENLIYEKIYV